MLSTARLHLPFPWVLMLWVTTYYKLLVSDTNKTQRNSSYFITSSFYKTLSFKLSRHHPWDIIIICYVLAPPPPRSVSTPMLDACLLYFVNKIMNQFGVYMYILINFFKFLIVIERDWRRKEKCPFIKMYVISIASFVHSATRKVFCSVRYIVITVSQIRCGTFNLYRHARSTPPPVRSAPKAFRWYL